jgi:hypothetical protein
MRMARAFIAPHGPAGLAGGVLILSLLAAVPGAAAATPDRIDAYRIRFGVLAGAPGGPDLIVLREFQQDGRPLYLAVRPDDLATEIVPAAPGDIREAPLDAIRRGAAGTPYVRALADAESRSRNLQDAGITHLLPTERGVSLTIDLCPSRRPLDRKLFLGLVAALAEIERPVPLAISLSGVWMEDHPDDLGWLLGLVRGGEIRVDWIDHSYHHRFDPRLPLRENFLLEKGTDLAAEILRTEQAMIANGLVPSVFFRFPGLVSDPTLFGRVTAFGLIPVGSDAWLAKGQAARSGSIVLIHGNGNEPLGVKDFLELLSREKAGIKKGQWLLFDLRDGLAREEKESSPPAAGIPNRRRGRARMNANGR